MGVWLGLMAAVGWGIADFLVAQTSRRIGSWQALFFIQFAGLLAILAVLAVRFDMPTAPLWTWALAAGLGALNMICTALLYRSYTIGTLSIVSPITSGFAVVTALLALASGERPAPIALLGALLLVGGVVVVARSPTTPGHAVHSPHARRASLPPGVAEAILVAFGFGVYFWGLDFVTPSLGAIWPVIISRLIALAGISAWMAHSAIRLIKLPKAMLPLVLGAAAMDTLAFVSFTTGIGSEDTTIVTALASLFSGVTVLLAWAFNRERLVAYQWVGVGVILTGVLLVSV